jgi:hypothetical protein
LKVTASNFSAKQIMQIVTVAAAFKRAFYTRPVRETDEWLWQSSEQFCATMNRLRSVRARESMAGATIGDALSHRPDATLDDLLNN